MASSGRIISVVDNGVNAVITLPLHCVDGRTDGEFGSSAAAWILAEC